MTTEVIQAALAEITAETDPASRHLRLASHPQPFAPADHCARKLLAVALRGQVEIDWAEVRRLAARPEFDILALLLRRVGEIANELGTPNPYDSERASP